MRRSGSWALRQASPLLAIATAIMAVLLAALAVLQLRWANQVSAAERERLERGLRTAAARIADDFDREIFRAFVAFQVRRDRDEPLAERLAEGWDRWRATALEPEMIRAVYVLAAAAPGASRSVELERLEPESRRLEPAAWPEELGALDQRLEGARGPGRPGAPRQRWPRGPVLSSAPAVLFPVFPAGAGGPGEGGGGRTPVEPRLVVVLLDRAVIAERVLPSIVSLHLGPEPGETDLWVLERGRGGAKVFATTATLAPPPPWTAADVVARPVLGLRLFPELRAQGFQRFFDEPMEWEPDRLPAPGDEPAVPDQRGERPGRGARPGGPPYGPRDDRGGGNPFTRALATPSAETAPWVLVLAPREGSLDAAVARFRRRNLAVGFGVVGLLGATAVLLILAARQAQRLTRRELELVAGVTHELRTPLAAIASAADNLADGVVSEPAQLRRYADLIRGETRRLGTLVSQVLDFAGTATLGRHGRPLERVDVEAVVDRVLADHRFTIEHSGVEVERRVAPGTPPAWADAEALRRALDNVVGNALKYGHSGRWLGIEVGPASGRGGAGRVAVRVRDRGPGVPRGERRRVFEAFYRGARRTEHQHGTGLGLAVTRSVLESFGGTIEIEDGETAGATFVLTLPAAETARDPQASPTLDDAPATES